jgi:predicted ATP-grasp superfamily ATP-dependent carboligase
LARILVLDGHSAAALAIVRSAGLAAHYVAVGANQGLFAPAKLSRYCNYAFEYPVSTEDAGAFVESVLAFARAHSIDLIIPVTDWTLGPISDQRDRYLECRLALPPQTALHAVSDKYRTIQLAASLGIDVPSTRLIESISDLAPREETPFPVVVKDRFSVRWINGKAVFGSVAYVHSADELNRIVTERLRLAGDVLVQEFVSGVGIGFSCFAAGGKVFLPFQWQRIREVDPRGSGSSARKSLPLSRDLASLSAKLVTEMCFEGLGMVEYKKAKDGRLILMEINGRPWGSIGLPIACGIDYPRYLIEFLLHEKLPPETLPYKVNVVCRRAVGELTHLSNLRAGPPVNWPIPYPNFWSGVANMAVLWRPGMCYDDLWFSDPRPGTAGISNWFWSRMKKRLRLRS